MVHRRRPIEPPPGLDPLLARFIEALARAAARRDREDLRSQLPDIDQSWPEVQ